MIGSRRTGARFTAKTAALSGALTGVMCVLLGACKTSSSGVTTGTVDVRAAALPALRVLSGPLEGGGTELGAADASEFLDCVGVLFVTSERGLLAGNARRFGESNPLLRTAYRISDLAASDLRDFCDWESCIRTDGYRHTCFITDAGWERCRVCDGGGDCDGRPMSQDDCVAHATDAGRASCHVGLLQECLLQQAVRGPADPRWTQTCALSAQACAGQAPGDLSTQALAAQNETNQVAAQVAYEELAVASAGNPAEAGDMVAYWDQTLSSWEGGMPIDVADSSAGDGPSDAVAAGADAQDGHAGGD